MDHGALNHRAVGLLLSTRVDARVGARIDALARRAGVALVRHTPHRLPARLEGIQAAFFSRDVYEGSDLRQPGPLSDAYFRIIDASPALRWLHVCSSGLDLPQYQPALTRGVRLTSARGSTAQPIAQTVLAAVMAQGRGFDRWLASQAARRWAPLRGEAQPRDLVGQHAVVMGAGAIGTEVARLLRLVGLHVTVVRQGSTPAPHADCTTTLAGLDEWLPMCDWLILALPLTAQTRGVIDARRLTLLPVTSRVINVARGELIDEAALATSLQTGRLAGAYLDTFVQEPLPADSPWWSMPGVWLSPHNSAASLGHEDRVVDTFLRELAVWLDDVARTR